MGGERRPSAVRSTQPTGPRIHLTKIGTRTAPVGRTQISAHAGWPADARKGPWPMHAVTAVIRSCARNGLCRQ